MELATSEHIVTASRRTVVGRLRMQATRACALALVLVSAAIAIAAVAPVTASAAPAAAAPTVVLPTTAEIDAHLIAKGSPMAGQGAAFVASGGAWKVDPRLLVAIAGAESAYGRITCAPYNAWGWGCPNNPYDFESWADAIDTIDRGLRANYLSQGLTSVPLIGAKYAPVGAANDPTNLNSAWVINVSAILVEMGGDPNDVDLSDSKFTLPLGGSPLDAGASSSGFAATAVGPAAKAEDAPAVRPGGPVQVELSVENTGTSDWLANSVRLRRLDSDPRLASSKYAALKGETVKAGESATFTIQFAARGQQNEVVETEWRLEGPAGPFGDRLQRTVKVTIDEVVVGAADVTAPETLAAGESSAVIVKARNDGQRTWTREGNGEALLGIINAKGASLQSDRWVSPTIPARLLERTVEPGEWGSFAFPVTMGQGSEKGKLELRVFQLDRWATGVPVRVSVEPARPSA